MKRLNKLLSAISKFSSRDYTARYINGIKFDLRLQTIEATDGHAAIIVKGSKGLVAAMANEYAEHLGLEPVGGDFGVIKLAPANGKKWWPNAERLNEELTQKANLHHCLIFHHDPELNKYAYVHNDQFKRLNQFCKAVKVPLKLIPGENPVRALMQYGKGSFNGEDVYFCIAQMPSLRMTYDANDNPTSTCIRYESLDEIDQTTMAMFKEMA
jgi:hypothetical protein